MKQVSQSFIRPRLVTRPCVRNCSLMVCCLLAVFAGYALRVRVSSDGKAVAPSVTLRGEEAIAHLKQQGSYDSLAAVMEATRYQVRQYERPGLMARGGKWQAANASQRFKADFTYAAVSIAEYDTPAERTVASPDWQFAMKLTGYGYGDRLLPVSEGTITANGSRIELARTALADASAKITEWYINDAKGLEQGFTLDAPPPTSRLNLTGEKLRLRLALTGDLRAKGSSDGQAVALLNRQGAQVLNYGGLVVRDALGRELEARMTASESEVVIETDDAGAVYPVVIDPIFTQFNKLIASDGAQSDEFGDALALSGDTALVGVPNDGSSMIFQQGSAYVFVRNGTSWAQQQKLTDIDGQAGDYFGVSVALSGETALVGAYRDDIAANDAQGSAYVFVRTGTTWTQQQKLTDIDGQAGDFFGFSVALSGDTALIGAYGHDIAANPTQGSAYVFVRNGTTWTQQQKLIASDGAADDQFGQSVALSSDTALIGANADDIGVNSGQGSAYVFVRNEAIWTQQQKLIASDGAAEDRFGYSVALNGGTALVGARFDDIGQNFDQGSAYVFVRSGTIWTQQQKLTASDGEAADQFGYVALNGDTALVGASDDMIGPVGGGKDQPTSLRAAGRSGRSSKN